ncbi:MAG: hypothetical protein ABI860_01935 [Gemmatimonadales bacterium]
MSESLLRRLLAGAVDYAGLFPPAALDMPAAVGEFAGHLAGPDAWAMGRFVVPVARLAELEEAVEGPAPRVPAEAWRLSALVGADAAADLRSLGEFNCRHAVPGAPALSGDVIEARAGSVEAIDRLLGALPRWATAYVEIPLDRDPSPLVAAIARHGARAKARTGGVTADAIPAAGDLLRFLRACTAARIPFKATAGLHHPLRAEYALTYAPDSARAAMFGYLNVFLAAAWLRQGLGDADALGLLEERSPEAFVFGDDAIEWRGHRLDRAALLDARGSAIVSFGSCSFTEPVEELRALAPV